MVALGMLMASVLCGTGSTGPARVHPMHLTVTTMAYMPEQQSLRVALRIFADDLSEAVTMASLTPIDLTDSVSAHEEKHMFAYLTSRFQLEVDGKVVDYAIAKHKLEKDMVIPALWCFVEVNLEEPPSEVVLRNYLLTKLYDDQKNIVHWQTDEGTESILLDASITRHKFSF